MLKIRLITVGKLKSQYLKEGIQDYQKRLSKYVKLDIIELTDEKGDDQLSLRELELIQEKEGLRILKQIYPDDWVIALAIDGQAIDSVGLAQQVEAWMTKGKSKLCFVIGGSYGLSQSVYQRSDYQLSFSKMTFPHQLMRLILMEQLFRTFKIINHEIYHK